MSKIYALLDYSTLISKSISIRDFISIAKRVDASLLQYRDKISSEKEMIKNLKEIKKYWEKPLIVNDKIELIFYADGLHLGQEDIKEFDKDIKKPF